MAEDLGYLKNDPSFCTRAVHKSGSPDDWTHAPLVPPITLATTFKQYSPTKLGTHLYTRISNPTRDCLESCLAALEDAKHCLAVSSGLAALNTITHLLRPGDHLISMEDLYGGTYTFFNGIARNMGIEVQFTDLRDLSALKGALRRNTKMVWVETPTNPTMKLIDIAAVATILKEHGAGAIMAVDNTFMSPYYQRPLTLGADIVMHSMTKYLGGHSDVVMGGILTNRDDLYEKLSFLRTIGGPVPSPFDCYLMTRSLKTLSLRMERHMSNGLAVARFLETHPCVEKVLHPGLPSHPQHELAKRQNYGHSGMFSFCVKGNDMAISTKFLTSLKVFTLTVSLAGPESICTLPATMTQNEVSKEERERYGITDGFIRVSCGLEATQDLIEDIDQALRAAVPEGITSRL